MAYVRPYVNQMLNKHPLGKEFRIIRELILHYEEGPKAILASLNNPIDYQGPYKGTYQGSYRNFYVNKLLRIIFSFFSPRGRHNRSRGEIYKTSQCAEEAAKRAKIVLQYLDQSKESQWIITYMLEDPLRRAPVISSTLSDENFYRPVINMFEDYLKECQD